MSNDEPQDIHEIPSSTPDFKTELAAQLAELMPEAIADGKVDVEKLKELLGDDAGDERERFGLFWAGKKRALRAAQEPTTATLKPDYENSKDWDTTENVFIEGDNLEVLKILQKHYHGKIKMIYIDPPYNTGKDFVYPDNYKEGLATYLEWTRQVNEEGKKVSTNSESEGRYHSNWLNMIYPRMKLARNLLARDGVMFISIGETEKENLTKLCAEIFGEDNVESMVWNKISEEGSAGQGKMKVTHRFRKDHEYVLVVYREKASSTFNKPSRVKKFKNEYPNADNDPRGPWVSSELCKSEDKSLATGKNFYTTTTPGGVEYSRQWHVDRTEFDRLDSEGRIYWGQGTTLPRLKKFVNEPQPVTPTSVISGFSQTEGNADLEVLMASKGLFDNPKPLGLVKWLVEIASGSDSLILDFFAGSGTSADAILRLNAEDGGLRRFIQVQLPEPIPERSAALAAGYETISQLSRNRIGRVGEAIGMGSSSSDVGFRSYRLSDTSFSRWRVASDVETTKLEQHLLDLRDSADDDATPDALLTELLLKQGYSLTERIGDAEVEGLSLKSVGDGLMLAYLDEHTKPTLQQLRAVLDSEDLAKFIILEDAFKGDDELKTNLVQEAKSRNVELWTA